MPIRRPATLLGVEARALVGRTLDKVIKLVDETDRKLLKDPIELALRGTDHGESGRRAFLLARTRGRGAFHRADRLATAQHATTPPRRSPAPWCCCTT